MVTVLGWLQVVCWGFSVFARSARNDLERGLWILGRQLLVNCFASCSSHVVCTGPLTGDASDYTVPLLSSFVSLPVVHPGRTPGAKRPRRLEARTDDAPSVEGAYPVPNEGGPCPVLRLVTLRDGPTPRRGKGATEDPHRAVGAAAKSF